MQKRILISAVSALVLVQIADVWAAESCSAEKLDLKLWLKPGQKFDMRLITELKGSETIEGREEHESFMFAWGMGFEVKEADPNGAASVKVTYQTLQMKVIRAGGYHVEYDSTKQSIADDYSKIPAIEVAGVGESFEMKVTPNGRIIELSGIERMHHRISEKVIGWDEKYVKTKYYERHRESLQEMRRLNTKSYYSQEEIKNMLSDMIMFFPGRPLAIGDSWTHKVKIWGKNYEIDGTYIVKDRQKGTVIINLTANRTPEEKVFSSVNNQGREQRFKIVGSCKGSLEIDEQSGWLIRSRVDMRFAGELIEKAGDKKMAQPTLQQEVITVERME
jgi:hypothetical protein